MYIGVCIGHRECNIHKAKASFEKSLDKLNTLGLYMQKHAKHISVFKNSFPYSTYVKRTVNKSQFDFA